MKRSALLACSALLAGVAIATAGPATATGLIDLYVDPSATGPSSVCTQSQPCTTVQAAIDLAADQPAVVHVATGTTWGQITVAGGGSRSPCSAPERRSFPTRARP